MTGRGGRAIGRVLAFSLILAGSSASARNASFTIPEILSAPFPHDLVAAPHGNAVAWAFDERGVKNIWAVDLTKKEQGRRLTSYAADDGSDLGELEWDRTGRTIFYSRGGSLEGGGLVNPMSLPSGTPKQEIWAISVDGGEPRRVAEGHTPSPSPAGDMVAYIFADQIWLATTGASDQKPIQLIHDRGRDRSIVWSPDGSRIAFVSTRDDHNFIGVYDFSRKTITWLAPSVDVDSAPTWSPDGKRVAFLRSATAKAHRSLTLRAGDPWSIWIADATSGEGHRIWSADPGQGSLFQRYGAGAPLFWAAHDRLIFPWEKTGWNRLYAVSVSGGRAELLTPGESEVVNARLNHDGDKVVFSQNLSTETDRPHLWEVSTSGGAQRQLTKGNTIEDYASYTENGTIVTLQSDGRRPMHPAVLGRDGKVSDLAPSAMPASFPKTAGLVEPQAVIFQAADGLQIHGQLYVPTGQKARGPALLFFHGGPRSQMFLGWHTMDAYTNMYGFNQYLLSKGYVILAVNYRGGIGYGLDFREAKGTGGGGGTEINDILGAIQFLKTRPEVDPKRIGLWGMSYGGLMTALGLARASDQLAAGVDIAGVHDWKTEIPAFTAPGADPAAAQLAYESSAIATAEKWTSPVLLIHGDDDRNVPFAQTVELIRALRQYGKAEFEEVIFPNEIHDYLRHQSWITLFEAADDFLNRKLPSNP